MRSDSWLAECIDEEVQETEISSKSDFDFVCMKSLRFVDLSYIESAYSCTLLHCLDLKIEKCIFYFILRTFKYLVISSTSSILLPSASINSKSTNI